MDDYRVERFKGVNGDYFGDFYINNIKVHSVMARTKAECVRKIDEFAYEIECGTWRNYVNPIRLKFYDMKIKQNRR